MAVTLTGSNGLFTRLGKLFFALQTLNTARLTTVPDEVEDIVDEFSGATIELQDTIKSLPSAAASFQSSAGSSLASTLKTAAGQILVQMVDDDVDLTDNTVTAAMTEVIAQMVSNSDDVDASAVSNTPALTGANTGNGALVGSIYRGDGKDCQNALAEVIDCEVTSVSGRGATWSAKGEVAKTNKLSAFWPKSSGVGTTFSTHYPGSSGDKLSGAGGFETSDDQSTNIPAGWVIETATLGTTLKVTPVEVQTFAISGTPTGGFYVIHWSNGSKSQTTVPLVYNATSSAVQTALRALDGLEEVTVVESGTTPNLTHTITMTGVTNPAQFTGTSSMTGGTPSITPGTSTAGSAYAYYGARALEFDGDGSQSTSLLLPLTVSNFKPKGQYAINLYAVTDSAPAAGVVTVRLVDGVGGSVIADDESTNNGFTIDCTALTTSHSTHNGVFRLPSTLPKLMYLHIYASTAISNTSSVFLDDVTLVEMKELYTEGPSVAAFAGNTNFVVGDTGTLTIANDRAGLVQEWCERVFDMRSKRLQLPVDTGGSETVADSVVA